MIKIENIREINCVEKAKRLLMQADYNEFHDCLVTLKSKFETGDREAEGALRESIIGLRSCLGAAMAGLSGAYAFQEGAKLAARGHGDTQRNIRL